MAVIGQRVFSQGVGSYVNVANEELTRSLSFGNNWNALKITLLVAGDFETTSNLVTALLTVGVCSGRIGFNNTPLNYIGAVFGGSLSSTWLYVANSGQPYFNTQSCGAVTKVGVAAATYSFGSANGHYFPVAPWTLKRCLISVYILKGSPNYTVAVSYDAGLRDFGVTNFLDAADQLTTGFITGGVTVNTTSVNMAASESPGPLDTVDIFWNRQAFPLEVYGLAVCRIS